MKKNNIDRTFTWNFGRMCLANALLFASVYMLLPLWPSMLEALGGPLNVAYKESIYLAVLLGMWVAGPFHAYLCDAYKRKSVLLIGLLILALTVVACLYFQDKRLLLGFFLLHGIGIGTATAAAITLAIDVSVSSLRSKANIYFAAFGRAGMLAGVFSSFYLKDWYSIQECIYISVAFIFLAILLVSKVRVIFYAPIGLPLCSLDRFFLPRGWLPALHLMLWAMAGGLSLPLMAKGYGCFAFLWLAVAILALPNTYVMVKFTEHCQRSTANVTTQMALESGVLLGLFFYYYEGSQDLSNPILWISILVILIAFFALSIPYCVKKRLRK